MDDQPEQAGRISPAAQPDDGLLRAAVIERLRASGYLALLRLECEVVEGVVTLSGSVPSFYLKQIALAVSLKVGGVHGLRHRVEVRAPAS
jgi:osmotically-inducible protein OsmY